MGYGRADSWIAVAALILGSATALGAGTADSGNGESGTAPSFLPPVRLALFDEPESVYPQVTAPTPEEGYNAGAVHFEMDASYWTRYVYRGVDQTTKGKSTENSLQFNGYAEFDLGKIPHPFIGLFANIFNNDPVSRFEEVRPFAGCKWIIKPLTVEAAYQNYQFPNRRAQDTQEIWASVSLDDSRVFRTEKPIFSPYIFGAWDFDLYQGFYIEAGLKHDFVFEGFGITLTPSADAAYVLHDKYFRQGAGTRDTGMQHAQFGMTVSYNLNGLFNIPRRLGEFQFKAYGFYTEGIDNQLRGDSRVYGGAGISFNY